MIRITDPADEGQRVVFAFDQAVDRLGEEVGFLSLGGRPQAARYLSHAHAALVEARDTIHRLHTAASDPVLRASASRRLRGMAQEVAEAGLEDARRVTRTARRLDSPASARDVGEATGWGSAIRVRTARATAWSVEKWTGSPLVSGSLQSPQKARSATEIAAELQRRERSRRRTKPGPWRSAGIAAAALASTGALALAAYGGWTLLGAFFGN